MSDPRPHKRRLPKPPILLLLVGVFCLVSLGVAVAVQIVRAEGRILRNVSVGGVDVGGLTPEEAREALRTALRALNIAGVSFGYENRALTVKASETSAAPPSQSPITYDIDAMAEEAFAFGHGPDASGFLKANLQALFVPIDLPVRLTVDRGALRDLLVLRFGSLEKPARDAELRIEAVKTAIETASGTPSMRDGWDIRIVPDSTGVTFAYDQAIERATEGLHRWRGADVPLQATVRLPDVTAAQAEAAKDRALAVLRRGDVSLAYDDLTWTMPAKALPEALTLKRRPDGGVIVALKREVLLPLLDEAAEEIETEALPTRFTVGEDGRVKDFQGGQLGKRVDREASLARADELFEASENGIIPVVVATTVSTESDPVAEELGIRELLGFGTSSFAGSPANRRKNIANGAARLNGIIIKPGEEMGLLQHLKPFDASGGYVQELVIKGNRTVPEYGGGLCQIGTTAFRATMGAGLPVTERQNHSFRVRYYEPAGTDATLYEPAPDYKFVNDTGHHVVLVTKVLGDILRFELWGTRDDRVQEQGKVRMWDVTPPPPAKLIETSELKEGEKKCFEKPVSGAKTAFTYTITYPDGRVEEKEFRSVYKPWQEQCLIGKSGAPRIVMQKDGALKELPPVEPASAPAPAGTTQPPGFN